MTADPRVVGYPSVAFRPQRRNANLQLTNALTTSTWTVTGIGGVTNLGAGPGFNQSSLFDFMCLGYATGALAGDIAGIASTAFTATDPRLNPRLSMMIAHDTIEWFTDSRVWWGLFSANPSGAGTLGSIVGAGFRFDTGEGDTTGIIAVTSDGTSQTATDTGFFPNFITEYMIVIDYAATEVHFYAYQPGQAEPFFKLATHGSGDNFPTDTNLGIVAVVTALAAADPKVFYLGRTYLEMD